jgi:hypothetical protein
MTDYELHRKEWIAERAGMLMCEGMPQKQADAIAADMWRQYEASKTAQEAAK